MSDSDWAYSRACGQCGSDVPGMSKREAVAMAAMQGYMAGLLAISQTFVIDLQQDQIVKVAFSIADAFLAKSKKSRGAGE